MSRNTRPTQSERVKKYMEDFGSITQLDAIRDLGVLRLSARIMELKQSGLLIEGKFEKAKNRYGEEVQVKRYAIVEVEKEAKAG
jgi:hypothetical protein